MENRMLENLELGPIRPPSEAESLLLRVTRNCPWNQCKFCGLYKGKKFSLRDKEEIKAEIRRVKHYADTGEFDGSSAAQMAHQWKLAGMKSVFLQDANTLIAPSEDLAEIIRLVKEEFPSVERVTSYARSHTVARKTEEELNTLFAAGLNRVHIGMESGCDAVLEGVKKGATKAIHIEAGRKIKAAGITLSEYYMPGLGGKEYSEKNAEETADALNQIDPDYIRIRTFVVIDGVPLAEDYANGRFTRTKDLDMVRELRRMISLLEGIHSRVVSNDHILNLIPEASGKLPEEKEKILGALDWFLALPEEEQLVFRVGRRIGYLHSRADLENPIFAGKVRELIEANQITAENIDELSEQLMKQFI